MIIPVKQNGTVIDGQFTTKQLLVLELLVTRPPDVTLGQIAEQAGISRTTLWRLLKNEAFNYELQLRVRDLSRSWMGAIMLGLVKQAAKGDAGCQRIYWQLAGKLQESIEVTREKRGIETATIDPDKLSPELREELWRQLSSGNIIKTIGNGETESTETENDIGSLPDSIVDLDLFRDE